MLHVTSDEETGYSNVRAGLLLCRKIVGSLIKRMCIPPNLWDDLMGAAHLGLTQALKRYRPEVCQNFLAFASSRIRGACIDYLRSSAELPSKVYKMIKALKNVEDILENTTTDDCAEILCLGALTFKLSMLSESAPNIASDSDGPEEMMAKKQITLLLRELISTMPPHLRDFYERCYVEEMDFADYARHRRISRSAVSKLNRRLLNAVKKKLYESGFLV